MQFRQFNKISSFKKLAVKDRCRNALNGAVAKNKRVVKEGYKNYKTTLTNQKSLLRGSKL